MPEYSDKEKILPPLTEDEKMWAGLCYPFWFVFSFWTLKFKKKDDVDLFVYFHAIQGLTWGIITSGTTLISFLVIFLVFFRKNVGNLSQGTPVDNMGKMMGCGLIAVAVLFAAMIFLIVVIFMTLNYGWKATSGIMFRIPFVGKIAWEKVYEEKKRREDLYYESIGEKPPEPSTGREDLFDPGAPLSPEPQLDFERESSYSTTARVDYEEMMIQNPPVEKLKSIFSQPEEEEELEVLVEEEIIEEVIIQQAPAEERKPLSPLEKLTQLRGQQAEEKTVEKPPTPTLREEMFPPVVKKPRKPLSPLEQLKLRQQQEKALSGILEVKQEQEVPQAPPTVPLDPGQRLYKIEREILKIDSDTDEEIEEESAIPPPRRTAFLDPRKFPGVMQDLREIKKSSRAEETGKRRIKEIPQKRSKTGMSPLEQLSRRQKQKKKLQPVMSEEEKSIRTKAMLERMKKKQGNANFQKEDEDEIF
ncbi:MAG: hypothetical protein K8T10_09410 [Candidatus Eremiobacteraeota bacterium]|nr:hypothetical protein [Candidatus Eremiobacteraeota bacterium]